MDNYYMQRCLHLAGLGAGQVAPNPMVGALLVYDDRIIGEGYHQQYGQAHAEVNCLHSVRDEDRSLIPASTLYVSLEPCAHFGKTPPCADLILQHQIKKVVIAMRDPFEAEDGKGIEKLQAAGVSVHPGVLEDAALELNRRFLHFHTRHRPYIILKWAESLNGAIAGKDKTPVRISSPAMNRLVHQWRAEESAILIGANTALIDNPALTVRLVKGKNPIRLLIDPSLKVPDSSVLMNGEAPAIIYNYVKSGKKGELEWVKLHRELPIPDQLLEDCYNRNILSILVEGGSQTIQSFLEAGYWEEIRQIRSNSLVIEEGYRAPQLTNGQLHQRFTCSTDDVFIYRP